MALLRYISGVVVSLVAISAQAGISIGGDGIYVGGVSIDGAGVSIDDDIVITGGKSDIDTPSADARYLCNTRQPNVSITDSNQDVVITGYCDTIRVSGANNSIDAEYGRLLHESGANNEIRIRTVSHIKVDGTNTDIQYHRGVNGRNPQVSITGVNASVERW